MSYRSSLCSRSWLSNETPFGYKWVQLFEFDEQDHIARFHEFFDTHVLVSAVRQ